MVLTPHEKAIHQIRTFFTSHFRSPASPNHLENDLKQALESPFLKHHIFANNVIAILDHSIHNYRYMSPLVKDIFGVDAKVFLERGLDFAMAMSFPEDTKTLQSALEQATEIVMTLKPEDKMFFRFNYDFRLNSPIGKIRVYQQTIPLALNDDGYPYLLLAILSDITQFRIDEGMHYKLTLNLPGQPLKILLSGGMENTTLLSEREKEIVHHLSEGLDSNDIAEKLFISEGTVRTHRKNILEKTGAKNTVHLVRMALANGWV